MKNEMIRNVAGVIVLYLLIVGGVMLINARMGNVAESSNAVSLRN